jgi:hypothetical protein
MDPAHDLITTPQVNHFGERVWLKPCLSETGVRLGVTDCCFQDEPCAEHAALERPKE